MGKLSLSFPQRPATPTAKLHYRICSKLAVAHEGWLDTILNLIIHVFLSEISCFSRLSNCDCILQLRSLQSFEWNTVYLSIIDKAVWTLAFHGEPKFV